MRRFIAVVFGVVGVAGGALAIDAVERSDPDIAQVKTGEPPPARELVVDAGDLDAVVKRGALRVLVFGDDEPFLPRAGAPPLASDLELAQALAENLHVAAEPVRVDRFDDLVPMLLAGKGDVIAARLTVTAARKKLVAFSRPTAVVSELLIGRRGAANPKSVADVAGRAVVARASSSYAETLADLKAKLVAAPENASEADLVRDVAAGKAELTACDSDQLEDIRAFAGDGVEALFPLRERREVALAFRPTNPKLKIAADAFLVQRALTEHRNDAATGDLAEIKKRGSLRVILRNNAVSYFLYRGVQQGFDYELLKGFAKENGLRIDVVVPREQSEVVPVLVGGRGDVIATEMTPTAARKEQIAFSQPYLFADEVLVQRAGDPPIASLDGLRGRAIHVRKTSSYRATLDALQAEHGPFTVVDAPEDQETEEIVARVGKGELPLTMADSTIAAVEIGAHKGARTTLALRTHDPIALGVRKDNPELLRALDAYLECHKRSGDVERLRRKYFESRPENDAAHVDVRVTGKLSSYDAVIKRWSRSYGIDWRLMAAQAYQESAFNPDAESWCGALGLFQVMPQTGRALGFADVKRPEQNIHAGVMYMAQLIDSWDAKLSFKQRVRFALASYNAGHGHVEDARALAVEMGLDPDRWFGNVEKAMLRLEDPKVARRMPHGWCRGSEPVKYVSDIQSRYDNWVSVFHDDGSK
jgi:membrane-bound lytic murein transglycosylase F